jgi:predicted molibdopterin-dependent oxidoreductase YjgC
VPEGTVFSTFYSAEVPVNALTIDTFDRLGFVPSLKVCAVKIEKI